MGLCLRIAVLFPPRALRAELVAPLRKPRRRARSLLSWLDEPPSRTDPSWAREAVPIARLLQRCKRGRTMRQIVLWGRDRRTRRDPREVVSWLEQRGQVAWVGARWRWVGCAN